MAPIIIINPIKVVQTIFSCRIKLIKKSAINGTRKEKLPNLAVFVVVLRAFNHSKKVMPISNAPIYNAEEIPFTENERLIEEKCMYVIVKTVAIEKLIKSTC